MAGWMKNRDEEVASLASGRESGTKQFEKQ